MATISIKQLNKVKEFYYDKLYSAQEIAKELNVSLDAVYYFMRHHNFKRRDLKEGNKVRFQKKSPSFSVKKKLSRAEQDLKMIGTMLYWGEGCKSNKSTVVDFANSDLDMILFFLNFLRKVCGIKEEKLRVLLYCYSNQDVGKLMDFWSKLCNIPLRQFIKPYIREDFNINTKRKMEYGLIHIRYADKKLLLLIKQWIEDNKKKFCVGTQVVNGV